MFDFMVEIAIGLFIVFLGILLYFGKCLNLIAGYNTISKEEKGETNKEHLGRTTGIFVSAIGIIVVITKIISYTYPEYAKTISIILTIVIIVFVFILIKVINGNKYHR